MFRKLALFCVFLTLCTIILGAYVRISDAGLGCPDWPGCFGKPIVDEPPQFTSTDAQTRLAGRIGAGKAWLEMAHRYLAATLGVFVLGLFALSFRVRVRRVSAVALAFVAVSLVGLQLALGMWTATSSLMPVAVLGHLMAGFATLGVLYWLSLAQCPAALSRPSAGSWLRWLARVGLATLLVQIALGGWTSANYAALACPDFPACMGSFNPPVDYAAGFSQPSGTGVDYQGGWLPVAARAAIHWSHRLGAAAVFFLLGGLSLVLAFNRSASGLRMPASALGVLLLAQIGLGAAAVALRLPVPVAVAHSAFAALLLLNHLHLVFFLRAPIAKALPEALKAPPARRELPQIPGEVLPPPLVVPPPVEVVPPAEKLFVRLKSGLGKTRGGLTGFLTNLALGRKTIDGDLLEDIEAQLLMADIGVAATSEMIRNLTDSLERSQLGDLDALTARLRDHLYELIEPVSRPLLISPEKKPFVILVVGVNGVGKTTTIGKLANRLKNQGNSVMLAAGDTFRAAAVEQLQTWGERNQIQVVAQHSGADSASVIFDGVQAAQSRGIDVLIADTAGRLHTKSNLMEELTKIKRIMGKLDPSAPHEVLLVLDAGTGQNAINQAKQFNDAVGLTGLAVTKLDGTAKGGVVFALAKQFGIPIRYIGVGEAIDDLQDFDARKFIDALFAQ